MSSKLRKILDIFPSAFNDIGYTHLLVINKKTKSIADELERLVKTGYPELWARCGEGVGV